MSKKHNARPNNPDAVKAQRAQILGFVAGAILVIIIAVVAVKMTTPSAPAAAPSEAAAMPSAVPAPAPAMAEAAMPSPNGEFKRISVDEVKALQDKGKVMILDVRDMDQYLAQHIDGAGQIPVARLQGEIPYMPKDKTIVLYCTCPNEESSGVGAQILAQGGLKDVAALTGGMQAWIDKGLPTKSGNS